MVFTGEHTRNFTKEKSYYMITSESTNLLSEALMLFHKEVGKIKKSANNPFFKTKYADLSGILDVIQDPLLSNGLVITQFPEGEDTLTTRLMHRSGEWMQSSFVIKAVPDYLKEKDKNGNILWRGSEYVSPQAMGSAITYARRYAQTAILNLNIADDDGNEASARTIVKKPAITTSQWSNALKRIQQGETGIVQKLRDTYALTPAQLVTLGEKA